MKIIARKRVRIARAPTEMCLRSTFSTSPTGTIVPKSLDPVANMPPHRRVRCLTRRGISVADARCLFAAVMFYSVCFWRPPKPQAANRIPFGLLILLWLVFVYVLMIQFNVIGFHMKCSKLESEWWLLYFIMDENLNEFQRIHIQNSKLLFSENSHSRVFHHPNPVARKPAFFMSAGRAVQSGHCRHVPRRVSVGGWPHSDNIAHGRHANMYHIKHRRRWFNAIPQTDCDWPRTANAHWNTHWICHMYTYEAHQTEFRAKSIIRLRFVKHGRFHTCRRRVIDIHEWTRTPVCSHLSVRLAQDRRRMPPEMWNHGCLCRYYTYVSNIRWAHIWYMVRTCGFVCW